MRYVGRKWRDLKHIHGIVGPSEYGVGSGKRRSVGYSDIDIRYVDSSTRFSLFTQTIRQKPQSSEPRINDSEMRG